ncbi:hypothetical protein E2562_009448 [Oryza meyeriana var. granulata]|uniref:Uncharacterized protein n=1 Tax=Oryza meyeriana var. granulata TaxID=110450 RepID=A0A6G1BU45_9ORYZ|nr:hypothetical protein E2562_009448 [Oryza meyeriana var. granulata]
MVATGIEASEDSERHQRRVWAPIFLHGAWRGRGRVWRGRVASAAAMENVRWLSKRRAMR